MLAISTVKNFALIFIFPEWQKRVNGTPVESGNYGWVQDFVEELLVLDREGYVNRAVATAVVHDLIELSRKIRGLQ
jgi:hypothetical protein